MPSMGEMAASCGSENLILRVFLAEPRHETAFKLGRDVRGSGFAACHTALRKGVHKSLGTHERRSPELRLLPFNPFLW